MADTVMEGPTPATSAPAKRRKKRSWTSVVFTVDDERWRVWLTPQGLFARKRRSRRVWTQGNARDTIDYITGQKHLPL